MNKERLQAINNVIDKRRLRGARISQLIRYLLNLKKDDKHTNYIIDMIIQGEILKRRI